MTSLKTIFSIKIILMATCAFVLMFLPSETSAATLIKPANNIGLNAYWSFDEASGTVATDFSGNENKGTLLNVAAPATAISGWTPLGKRGNALSLDGANDYVSVPTYTGGTATQTVAAWIYLNGSMSNNYIVDQGGNNNVIRIGPSNVFSGWADVGAVILNGSTSLVPGRWYFVAKTFDGTTLKLYVNGVEDASSATTGAAPGPDLSIGSYTDGQGYEFNGRVDEVRIYNRSLTASEIVALYNLGAEKISPKMKNSDLIGYWSFDQGSGTIAPDFSSSQKNGILTNFASPSTTTSGWKEQGQVRGNLVFDGVNDYVNLGAYSQTDGVPKLTVSGWVYKRSGTVSGAMFAKYNGTNDWLAVPYFFSGDLYVVMSNGSFSYGVMSSTLSGWAYYTMVFDGTETGNANRLKLYINGVQQTLTFTGTIPTTTPTAATNRIGMEPHNSFSMNGEIDEVRIYNTALSNAEINALFATSPRQKVNVSQIKTNTTLDNGLLGFWTFDGNDMTSSSALDRSGYGNTATAVSTAPTIGKVRQGLFFEAGAYVNAGSGPNLFTGTGNMSMSVWVKTVDTGDSQMMLFNGDETANNSVYLWKNASGNVEFGTYGAGAGSVPSFSKSQIQDGHWHHLVGTKAGNTMSVYLDGVLKDSDAVSGIDITAGYYRMGGTVTAGFSYNGALDEVRHYNRALSASEVKQLYNRGK